MLATSSSAMAGMHVVFMYICKCLAAHMWTLWESFLEEGIGGHAGVKVCCLSVTHTHT